MVLFYYLRLFCLYFVLLKKDNFTKCQSAERQTFTNELEIQPDGDPPEVSEMCIGALVWQTKNTVGRR